MDQLSPFNTLIHRIDPRTKSLMNDNNCNIDKNALEEKRRRNRAAAKKCRDGKAEKTRDLEREHDMLEIECSELEKENLRLYSECDDLVGYFTGFSIETLGNDQTLVNTVAEFGTFKDLAQQLISMEETQENKPENEVTKEFSKDEVDEKEGCQEIDSKSETEIDEKPQNDPQKAEKVQIETPIPKNSKIENSTLISLFDEALTPT